jgi:prophage regulatory protein
MLLRWQGMPPLPTGDPMTERVRFISTKETRHRTNLSERTQARLVAIGKFPKPVRLCDGHRIAYVEAEIDAWIQEQLAQNRGPPAADPQPPSPPPPKDGPGDRKPAKRGRRRANNARAGPQPAFGRLLEGPAPR